MNCHRCQGDGLLCVSCKQTDADCECGRAGNYYDNLPLVICPECNGSGKEEEEEAMNNRLPGTHVCSHCGQQWSGMIIGFVTSIGPCCSFHWPTR